MTHRQETPGTATSGPQNAEQPADDSLVADTRDRPPCGHTEPRDIRQLRAERDLLARTVAVYTRRTTADVLAETREALAHLEPPPMTNIDRTEQLARALAGAAHINPQRTVPPWDRLTPQQRDGYRAEAERATGKETN